MRLKTNVISTIDLKINKMFRIEVVLLNMILISCFGHFGHWGHPIAFGLFCRRKAVASRERSGARKGRGTSGTDALSGAKFVPIQTPCMRPLPALLLLHKKHMCNLTLPTIANDLFTNCLQNIANGYLKLCSRTYIM